MSSKIYLVKESGTGVGTGRYLMTGKALHAGEEIISEEPFVIGPKDASYLLCLGCYIPLEVPILCFKCLWPVCSPECSENPWHKDYECAIFSECGVRFQEGEDDSAQLSCITPLRVLLNSEKQPKRWAEEVANLESHYEKRMENPYWQAEQVNVVKFLNNQCKLSRFSEELIEKVCGILEVNAFEVVTRLSSSIRGLYPKTSLLNHSCVANTTHSVDPTNNFRIQLRATLDIGEGKELYSSYTSSFQPTIVRRARLRQHKYFSCTCQRCSDPTELGTHISTLKCTKCDNGIITSTDPLEDEAPWKCSHCDNGVTGQGVMRVFEAIQANLDVLDTMNMDSDRLEASEKALRSYKSVLHPHNGFNAMLWHSLGQMYGHVDGYTLDMMPDILLERKSQFCKDLLGILNVIEPGFTRIRGLTLFEYQVGLLMAARSQYQRGEISGEKLRLAMKEVLDLLQECVTILSLEPPSSPEAAIANMSRQSIEQLEQSIKQIE